MVPWLLQFFQSRKVEPVFVVLIGMALARSYAPDDDHPDFLTPSESTLDGGEVYAHFVRERFLVGPGEPLATMGVPMNESKQIFSSR